jgi:translocator protein
VCLFVGAAIALNGAIFATGAIRWSRTLANPSWSPPGPVIGMVWVVLFALMAGAAYVVDRRASPPRAGRARVAIIALWTLNMSWTALYFGLRNVPNGFYVTFAAWCLCIVTITLTVRAAKLAAALLLPLFGWLTFALALSWTTWQLNP